jgi:hypothetical protein
MTDPTYHDLPLLKGPVWTWEVPSYFFIGGAAGGAAVIAVAARIHGADPKLVRDARRFAALGANLATPLLIADLGRPERFLNMLRIFKPQSPMSVGAWIVAAFGAASTAGALADAAHRTRDSRSLRIAADSGAVVSALLGLGMMTYTGVLLAATAIPVWKQHVHLLPVHFGASALGSAVSLLELKGHRATALNVLGLGAAIFETLTGAAIEGRTDRESEPLRHGGSGRLTRLGGILSGPVPLALRILGAKKGAAISTLVGSLITRFAWVEAGKASAKDAGIAL